MATDDMLDYLGDKMDALDFDGDLNLNWDKESHTFEVELTMFVDASEDYDIEDQNGETVDDGEIDYSDAILFYDNTRLNGADYADNYLWTLGFAGKRGLEQAQADALFAYLQELLDDGQSDLLDFVDGTSDDETFALDFDETRYQSLYDQQPATAKETFIPYPKY